MARYRKKPIIIDATQWMKHGDHPSVENCTASSPTYCKRCKINTLYTHGWIETLEGRHIVCPGDWIIRGVKGELYSCKPDIFEMTYELLEEDTKNE